MALEKLIDEPDDDALDELKPGTKLLHGQYTIVRYLNSGGFGITYLAKDSLDRDVVIKECYADAFCRRTDSVVSARSRAHQGELKSIIRHFVQEAQSLSKLVHPNIVGVHQVFEDNDTAYMAIDYVEGQDLLEILEDPTRKFSPDQIVTITRKLLAAVGFIHDHSLLHRDISPDNILLDTAGEPILIDFGAARENIAMSNKKHSALRVVKDGYSPQEFYISGSDQGPWSDLYALAASLYHAITGEPPINGQNRLVAIAEQRPDPYVPLTGKISGYPAGFLQAIDKALITMPAKRIQLAREWLDMLENPAAVAKNGRAVGNIGKTTSKLFQTIDGKPTASTSPTSSRKTLVIAASSLAIVAVLGIVGYNNYSAKQDLIAAEQAEVSRLAAEAEATRFAEEAERARIAAENEAARIAAQAEAERAAAEAEVARVAAQAEADRIAAEAEAVRIAAEAEASRIATEAESARLAAEEEAERIAAQKQADLAAAEEAEARALAEAEAARLAEAAEVKRIADEEAAAAQLALEIETGRRAAEEEALRQAAADEAVRIAEAAEAAAQAAAAKEATALAAAEAEAGRRAAEEEAVRQAAEAQENAVRLAEDLAAAQITAAQVADADSLAEPTLQNGDVKDVAAVMYATTTPLPFTASATDPAAVGEIAGDAPAWLRPGNKIVSVNGIPIDSIREIQPVAVATAPIGTDGSVAVELGVEDQLSKTALLRSLELPVVENMALLNGMQFQSRIENGEWVTRVTASPGTGPDGFLNGDAVISYMKTNEVIQGRQGLRDLMEREIAAGTSSFNFAVKRSDAMWLVTMQYNGATLN